MAANSFKQMSRDGTIKRTEKTEEDNIAESALRMAQLRTGASQ